MERINETFKEGKRNKVEWSKNEEDKGSSINISQIDQSDFEFAYSEQLYNNKYGKITEISAKDFIKRILLGNLNNQEDIKLIYPKKRIFSPEFYENYENQFNKLKESAFLPPANFEEEFQEIIEIPESISQNQSREIKIVEVTKRLPQFLGKSKKTMKNSVEEKDYYDLERTTVMLRKRKYEEELRRKINKFKPSKTKIENKEVDIYKNAKKKPNENRKSLFFITKFIYNKCYSLILKIIIIQIYVRIFLARRKVERLKKEKSSASKKHTPRKGNKKEEDGMDILKDKILKKSILKRTHINNMRKDILSDKSKIKETKSNEQHNKELLKSSVITEILKKPILKNTHCYISKEIKRENIVSECIEKKERIIKNTRSSKTENIIRSKSKRSKEHNYKINGEGKKRANTVDMKDYKISKTKFEICSHEKLRNFKYNISNQQKLNYVPKKEDDFQCEELTLYKKPVLQDTNYYVSKATDLEVETFTFTGMLAINVINGKWNKTGTNVPIKIPMLHSHCYYTKKFIDFNGIELKAKYIQYMWRKYKLLVPILDNIKLDPLTLNKVAIFGKESELSNIQFIQDNWRKYKTNKDLKASIEPTKINNNIILGLYIDKIRTIRKTKVYKVPIDLKSSNCYVTKKRKLFLPTVEHQIIEPLLCNKDKILGKEDHLSKVQLIQDNWRLYTVNKANKAAIIPIKVNKDAITNCYIDKIRQIEPFKMPLDFISSNCYITKNRKAIKDLVVHPKSDRLLLNKVNIINKDKELANVQKIQHTWKSYKSKKTNVPIKLHRGNSFDSYITKSKQKTEVRPKITKENQANITKQIIKNYEKPIVLIQEGWKRALSSKSQSPSRIPSNFKTCGFYSTKQKQSPQNIINIPTRLDRCYFTKEQIKPNDEIKKCITIQNTLRKPRSDSLRKPVLRNKSVTKETKKYKPLLSINKDKTPVILKKTNILNKEPEINNVETIQRSYLLHLKNKDNDKIEPVKVNKDYASLPCYVSKEGYVIPKIYKLNSVPPCIITKTNKNVNDCEVYFIQRFWKKYNNDKSKQVEPIQKVKLLPQGAYTSKVYKAYIPEPIKKPIISKPCIINKEVSNIIEIEQKTKNLQDNWRKCRSSKKVKDSEETYFKPLYDKNKYYCSKERKIIPIKEEIPLIKDQFNLKPAYITKINKKAEQEPEPEIFPQFKPLITPCYFTKDTNNSKDLIDKTSNIQRTWRGYKTSKPKEEIYLKPKITNDYISKERKIINPIIEFSETIPPSIINKTNIINKPNETSNVCLIQGEWRKYKNKNSQPVNKPINNNMYITKENKSKIIEEEPLIIKPCIYTKENKKPIETIEENIYWTRLGNSKIINTYNKPIHTKTSLITKERKKLIPILTHPQLVPLFINKTEILNKVEELNDVKYIQKLYRTKRKTPEAIKIDKNRGKGIYISKSQGVTITKSEPKDQIEEKIYTNPTGFSRANSYISKERKRQITLLEHPQLEPLILQKDNIINKNDDISNVQLIQNKLKGKKTNKEPIIPIKIDKAPLNGSYLSKGRHIDINEEIIKIPKETFKINTCISKVRRPTASLINSRKNVPAIFTKTNIKEKEKDLANVQYIKQRWRNGKPIQQIEPIKIDKSKIAPLFITKSNRMQFDEDKLVIIKNKNLVLNNDNISEERKPLNKEITSNIIPPSIFSKDEIKDKENDILDIQKIQYYWNNYKTNKSDKQEPIKINKDNNNSYLSKTRCISQGEPTKIIQPHNESININYYISKEREARIPDKITEHIKSVPNVLTKNVIINKDKDLSKVQLIQQYWNLHKSNNNIPIKPIKIDKGKSLNSLITKSKQNPKPEIILQIPKANQSNITKKIIKNDEKTIVLIQKGWKNYQTNQNDNLSQIPCDYKNSGFYLSRAKAINSPSNVLKLSLKPERCCYTKDYIQSEDNIKKCITIQNILKKKKNNLYLQKPLISNNQITKETKKIIPIDTPNKDNITSTYVKTIIINQEPENNNIGKYFNELQNIKPLKIPKDISQCYLSKEQKQIDNIYKKELPTPSYISKENLINRFEVIPIIQKNWKDYRLRTSKEKGITINRVEYEVPPLCYISKSRRKQTKPEKQISPIQQIDLKEVTLIQPIKSTPAIYSKSLKNLSPKFSIIYLQKKFRDYLFLKKKLSIQSKPLSATRSSYISKLHKNPVVEQKTLTSKAIHPPAIFNKDIKSAKQGDLNKIKTIQRYWLEYILIRNKKGYNTLIPTKIYKDYYAKGTDYCTKVRRTKFDIVKRDTDAIPKNIPQKGILKSQNKKPQNDFGFIKLLMQIIRKNSQELGYKAIKNKALPSEESTFEIPKNESYYFSTLKRHLNITNNADESNPENKKIISKVNNLLHENIPMYYEEGYNKEIFPYINDNQRKNLEETNLYSKGETPLLAKYINYCIQKEKKIRYCKTDLIANRLGRSNLNNTNIFALNLFMDNLFQDILKSKFCQKCYCTEDENCGNCNCHKQLIEPKKHGMTMTITKRTEEMLEEENEFDEFETLIIKKKKRAKQDIDAIINTIRNRSTITDKKVHFSQIDGFKEELTYSQNESFNIAEITNIRHHLSKRVYKKVEDVQLLREEKEQ